MTEDERRNRNPAVEKVRVRIASHPVVGADELEVHRVYVVQSQRYILTLNYLGKRPSLHPVTFDTVVAHHFRGPRAALDVLLFALPDGAFEDAGGTRITVRRWMGEDA